MPNGKSPGMRCVQLTTDNRCRIFGQPDRPAGPTSPTGRFYLIAAVGIMLVGLAWLSKQRS